MAKTTVLFVCPDNRLLGPMAEACLNARGGGLMRAFSAGVAPAENVSRNAVRMLATHGINAEGLSPKPVDVFLMPHAVVPDRIIYLADLAAVRQPQAWKGTTSSHWWSVTGDGPLSDEFSACKLYYRRIEDALDALLEPGNA